MSIKNISDPTIDVGDLIKVGNKYIIVRKGKKDYCDGCIFRYGKHKKYSIPNLCDYNTIYCQANRRALRPDAKYFLIFDIFEGGI